MQTWYLQPDYGPAPVLLETEKILGRSRELQIGSETVSRQTCAACPASNCIDLKAMKRVYVQNVGALNHVPIATNSVVQVRSVV